MEDFKDETIHQLCELLNMLDDIGAMDDTDRDEYNQIIDRYVQVSHLNLHKKEVPDAMNLQETIYGLLNVGDIFYLPMRNVYLTCRKDKDMAQLFYGDTPANIKVDDTEFVFVKTK